MRRLLIYAKKIVAAAARIIVFSQNNANTQNQFTQLVNPVLGQIAAVGGLQKFAVVCDATNNPPGGQMNVLNGQILLQTVPIAEQVAISFAATSTGTSFGNSGSTTGTNS